MDNTTPDKPRTVVPLVLTIDVTTIPGVTPHTPEIADKGVDDTNDANVTANDFSFRYYLMLGSCVVFWYYTNALNGISIQSLTSKFVTSDTTLIDMMIIASGVTFIQLVCGVILGFIIQISMTQVLKKWPKTAGVSKKSFFSIRCNLGVLHCLGSLFTNLGFFYGKATMVQIIKLLEPIETLAISKVLMPRDTLISLKLGLIVAFVVANCIALLKSNSVAINRFSILFAILSGITLSLRNVLQKKYQIQHDGIAYTSIPTTTTPDSSTEFDNVQMVDRSKSKVHLSVVQFTNLSLESSIRMLMIMCSSILLKVFMFSSNYNSFYDCFLGIDVGITSWHPLYNIFSMVTLGQVDALTHSLLNAGKRVFAIIGTILWFGEYVTINILFSLIAVMMGGFLYVVEKKRLETTNSPKENRLY